MNSEGRVVDPTKEQLEAWICLYHARVHILDTGAPNQAYQMLWAAEGAVIKNRGIRLEDIEWSISPSSIDASPLAEESASGINETIPHHRV